MADFLVVEDSESTVNFLKLLFKNSGHEVTYCEDYAGAVATLEKRQRPFAAVVTDWQYIGIDGGPKSTSGGWDLLDYLAVNPQYRPKHILVGSGDDLTGKMDRWSGMNPLPLTYVKGTSFNNAVKALRDTLKNNL